VVLAAVEAHLGHDAADGLDAHGQRVDVKQEEVLDVVAALAAEDATLQRIHTQGVNMPPLAAVRCCIDGMRSQTLAKHAKNHSYFLQMID